MSARLTIVILACLVSVPALALADDARPVAVKAGSLIEGLESLAKQYGVDVIYPSDELKGMRTKGVSGTLEPKEAFKKLLEGTPLILKEQGGALLISLPNASARAPEQRAEHATGGSEADEHGKNGDSFRVAQVDQGPPASDSSMKKEEDEEAAEKKPTGSNKIPEILVKGSRILNVDVTRSQDDVQPYYIFDSTQINQSGATNVEEFLKERLTMNTLPQTNSQMFASVFSTTSQINLRGLGTNETLILINGHRAAGLAFDENTLQTDINGIPLSAIERIEVLPSSASAIYGGAAVGGVVNIILKKQFEGGDVSYTYNNTFSGNAPLRNLNMTYGVTFDEGRTNIMVAGNYSDGRAPEIRDRLDIVDRGISTIARNAPALLYSPFTPFQGATPNIGSADGSNLVLKNGTPLNAPITSVPAGAVPGANIASGLLANAGAYNLALASGTGQLGLENPMGTVPTNKFLTATLRQQFTDRFSAFTELSTQSNSSRTLANPFYNPYLVPSSAPTNPFRQDVYVTFPSALGTHLATDSVTHTATVGLLGRLGDDWSAELDYTWSKNAFEVHYDTSDDTDLSAALASGEVNPFVDTIAHPLALAAYLAPSSFSRGETLSDVGLRLSGPLFTLPWGSPTLTVGLEHRKEGGTDGEEFYNYPLDPSATVHKHYFSQSQSTNSIYAEANVPLVTTKNAVPLLRSLELQLAGRSERYAVDTGTPYVYLSPAADIPDNPPQGLHSTVNYTSTNPTVGFKYKPQEDVSFRVSYASAFLPPTPAQLLINPVVSTYLTTITDPLNNLTYGVLTKGAGNPNLQPQTARDWDAGVIFEPQEETLKGLRLDLEYYRITQPNYITQPSAQQVVSTPQYAGRVTRNPSTGLITLVDISYVNAIKYETNGWDLTVDYRKPTSIGIFGLHLLGTWIEHDYRQYAIGSPSVDFAGYPAEGGEAKAKANGTLTWQAHSWTVGWTTTYFGSYKQEASPGSPFDIEFDLHGTYTLFTAAQGGFTIPSQIYHDVFGGFTFETERSDRGPRFVRSLLSGLTLQLGIKNVFNKRPPFDAFYAPYYYSPYGDPRLRAYWATLRKQF